MLGFAFNINSRAIFFVFETFNNRNTFANRFANRRVPSIFSTIGKSQVFPPVVKFIAVDMICKFFRFQSSAKFASQYHSMHQLSIISFCFFVPLMSSGVTGSRIVHPLNILQIMVATIYHCILAFREFDLFKHVNSTKRKSPLRGLLSERANARTHPIWGDISKILFARPLSKLIITQAGVSVNV